MIRNILKIQNIYIKLVLGFIGLFMVAAGVYSKIMYSLLLTDKNVDIDWVFISGGFVLAVGAAKYNMIVDKIIVLVDFVIRRKFGTTPKKNEE